MHKILSFYWLNMEIKALNKHYRFRKMEMYVFVKTPIIVTVADYFIKRNEILKQKYLIYFMAIFNFMQRTLIFRRGGDGGF